MLGIGARLLLLLLLLPLQRRWLLGQRLCAFTVPAAAAGLAGHTCHRRLLLLLLLLLPLLLPLLLLLLLHPAGCCPCAACTRDCLASTLQAG
jgi:hypothetical protein